MFSNLESSITKWSLTGGFFGLLVSLATIFTQTIHWFQFDVWETIPLSKAYFWLGLDYSLLSKIPLPEVRHAMFWFLDAPLALASIAIGLVIGFIAALVMKVFRFIQHR